MNKLARLTLASLLLVGTSHIALAQQAQPGVTRTQDPGALPADDAEQDDADNTEVIVTGTRVPKAVDKIPGAITVITSAEVQRSLTLTEDNTAVLAKTVPGYSESNQTLNTLGETLRGRTSLYLFDGIPQSTPLRDGARNATFTDMAVVERIEVIGGASAAEGIGAAGGVVNYISKRATRPGTHFNVGGRVGSQFRDDSGIWKLQGDISHKDDNFDVFAAAAYVDRGATYDARGRRIGLSASSSLADSTQRNLFLKVGSDFGAGDAQRLEASGSYFKLASKGNYFYVPGSRALGIPDTSERGAQLVNGIDVLRTEFNEFIQGTVTYRNTDLFGGSLIATGYYARQAMRFPGSNDVDRQDPLIAPIGTLVDQSEIRSKKYGLRTSFTRPDFLLSGLEARIGIDAVYDETEQRLVISERVLVPPLKYTSFGPFLQLSYDIGPVTLSSGIRHENGQIKVDDYTTLFFRNRSFVEGGTLKYSNNLLNAGAIWRVGAGFSAFVAYSEGFTLPNVGIPLRNISTPGQSVVGILDLQAVVFDNTEVGVNWRPRWGSFGISYYHSYSKLGASLGVDPVTRDFVLNRRPIRITGIDATAEVRPTDTIRVNAVYSHVSGETSAANNVISPLSVTLGIVNIAPDKLNATVTWSPIPAASVSFGMDRLMDRSINEGRPGAERTTGRTLFDLTARYRVQGIGTISLGAENLFNKYYFLAFSQIDFFQNYFAGRGRTVSLTLRSDF